MSESTRRHERLERRVIAGDTLSVPGPAGRRVELHVPPGARGRSEVDLVIHFHGTAWLPQQAVAALDGRTVSAVLNLGSGSGVYHRSFAEPAAFDTLLAGLRRAIATTTGGAPTLRRITLSGFSAGHGAIRAILLEPRHFATVSAVLLLDGMHTSYVPEATTLANGGTLDTTNLAAFAAFAREAVQGRKRFLVTHSEIFPGTYASTTETADWLLGATGVPRRAVLRWGPRGMQQLAEARAGRFTLHGYAGNSAPDHVDQLHAMPELLRTLWR